MSSSALMVVVHSDDGVSWEQHGGEIDHGLTMLTRAWQGPRGLRGWGRGGDHAEGLPGGVLTGGGRHLGPQLALGALSNAGPFLLAPIIALFLLMDGAAMHKALVAMVPMFSWKSGLGPSVVNSTVCSSILRGMPAWAE